MPAKRRDRTEAIIANLRTSTDRSVEEWMAPLPAR